MALQLVLEADPAALSLIRERFRRWLGVHGWPDAEREDLLLAVSEAASNAAEHAYPPGVQGTIEIDGRIAEISDDARVIELTVRDRGCWRPIPELSENRRRGIPLMRAVVADLVIEGTDQGTCVMMRGRPVDR
ncbi:MAG: ATP-binding protein [Pseudonocardiaceae bacterium]